MKKSLLSIVCLSVLSLIAPLTSSATNSNEIYITNAWANQASPGRLLIQEANLPDITDDMGMPMETFGVTSIYMTIENAGDRPINLIGASSPVAQQAEIHESIIIIDRLEMQPLEGGIVIQPNETVVLQLGGLHIMLLNLFLPLDVGDTLTLILDFAVLDDDGNATDEMIYLVMAVPVLESAPDNSTDYVITGAWARATNMAPMNMSDMNMSDMNMSDMNMSDMDMDMTEEATMMIPPSAVYMNILNRGENDDRLIAVETSVSPIVEIHETNVVDDVMQMREIGMIDIPVGETVVLGTGGYHIMLIDLQRELYYEDAITLTLIFESGNEVTIGVPVRVRTADLMEMDS